MKQRIQIQLDKSDLVTLRRVAAAQARSVSAVVREATAEYLALHDVSPEAAWERAVSLADGFEDVRDATDVAREHDRYLADIYAE